MNYKQLESLNIGDKVILLKADNKSFPFFNSAVLPRVLTLSNVKEKELWFASKRDSSDTIYNQILPWQQSNLLYDEIKIIPYNETTRVLYAPNS